MANYLKFDMHGYHLGLPIMLITLCVFFLIGFLPSLLSLQAYSNKRHIDRNNIVHKNGSKDHQKLVLVVVDALQRDFVLETNDIHVKKDWPFLRSLFTNRKACIFEGIADSPTVTMPRIKAMVSGTVPNFVDILYNLQSEEYFEDNLIDIAIQHKKAILFYGDDTWVKMFPGAFLRYEGTTSFFASDYTEVDVNVTRHLDHELTTTDWDIMILHYLGLDHIGHIHGPASFLVSEKLLEMDAVLEKIYTGLKVRNEPFTLLMTGDHGMSPGGSHGGSSLEETQVPLVFVNDGCIQRFASGRRDLGTFRQIDVTPTLAGLLGVPNPKNNLGVHIPNILFSEQIFSVEHQAVLMLENLKHLYNIFATRGLSSHSFEQNFDLLKTKLMESSSSIETRREWLQKAFLFAKEIQSELGKGSNLYDLWTMVISAFSMFLVFFCSCIMIFGDSCCPSVRKPCPNSPFILILTGLGCISYVMISTYFSNEVFVTPPIIICFLQSGVTAYLFSLLHSLSLTKNLKANVFSLPQMFTLFGIVYQGFSLFSSSFVEEEHQTWYYLVPTLLLLISLKNIETTFTKIDSNEGMKVVQNRDFLSIMGTVCIHRIAKFWNQTGDKWAREMDIEDWLIGEDNYVALMVFFCMGIVGIWCLVVWEEKRNLKRIIFSSGMIAVLIYRYLDFLGLHTSQWLVYLPRSVYVLVFVLFLMAIFGRTFTPLPPLVLLLVLLRRAHNVPLLLLQLIQARLVQRPLTVLLQYEKGLFFLYAAYSWLGMMWFFYQGNSNSLSRIDVAAGYIGVGSYQPFLIGILLLISTFQGPLLAFVFYLKNLEMTNMNENEWSSRFWYLCLLRSFPLCLHFVTVIILRNHIFIWSVFAPKLVYEVTFTLLMFLITFISVFKRGTYYFVFNLCKYVQLGK